MATQQARPAKRGSRIMQYLIDQYRQNHPNQGPDVSPHLVAEWAVKKGLWRPIPLTPQQQLRRLLSRCLRETYLIDPKGREVRANLPVMEEVVTSDGLKRFSHWYPIFDAPKKVARASFSLRRRAAFADVVQIEFDFKSWNENNVFGEQLDPMDYNFNKDLAELAESTDYIDEPNPDDDGDDEGELLG